MFTPFIQHHGIFKKTSANIVLTTLCDLGAHPFDMHKSADELERLSYGTCTHWPLLDVGWSDPQPVGPISLRPLRLCARPRALTARGPLVGGPAFAIHGMVQDLQAVQPSYLCGFSTIAMIVMG